MAARRDSLAARSKMPPEIVEPSLQVAELAAQVPQQA
jgi:hypothetical protein